MVGTGTEPQFASPTDDSSFNIPEKKSASQEFYQHLLSEGYTSRKARRYMKKILRKEVTKQFKREQRMSLVETVEDEQVVE